MSPRSRDDLRINLWVVRDADGILHQARVLRVIEDGFVESFSASTKCHLNVAKLRNDRRDDWAGTRLPRLYLGGSPEFTIVEWHVREVPTCLACQGVVLPESWYDAP